MKKPTLKEAKEYAAQKNLDLDVEYWWWKNEERGWQVVMGKTVQPMKSWKGNMQTWARNKKRWDAKDTRPARKESFLDSYHKGKK